MPGPSQGAWDPWPADHAERRSLDRTAALLSVGVVEGCSRRPKTRTGRRVALAVEGARKASGVGRLVASRALGGVHSTVLGLRLPIGARLDERSSTTQQEVLIGGRDTEDPGYASGQRLKGAPRDRLRAAQAAPPVGALPISPSRHVASSVVSGTPSSGMVLGPAGIGSGRTSSPSPTSPASVPARPSQSAGVSP